ncbi:YitT family protein [Bacillus sp. 31A1R]|uniref:YitT family protein n=1 Tax=Robertmurraya mangrovi TaxID=3098077 RepID=A0ABU5ITG5_9BACI|nr:YitT family protein [Bacillus sp. 31A1R]MDZ5470452.1 YitT family protein [Bacillus sp. 31A1R]
MKKISLILLGCLITTIGVIILKHSNIVTGGTAGLSLSITYLTHLPFALIFFLINLPFYVFSVLRMGWNFTISTIGAVSILSLMTAVDQWLPNFSIPMLVGAVLGGLLIGIGLSIVFINGSSLGGANILALFLQKRYNVNPGQINFIFDLIVVVSSIYSVGLIRGLCSILSIFVTAKVISYYKNEIALKTTQRSVKKEAYAA